MNRAVAILVVLVASAACAVGPEGTAQTVDVTVDVAELGALSPFTGDGDSIAVSSYLVRNNRLVHVTREIDSRADVALAVSEVTIAGPTAAEQRSGLWSAVPIATSVGGVDVLDGVATMDLSPELASIGGLDELLAIGQLVLALTALPAVEAVTFQIDGTQVGVPLPDGPLVARPVTAVDYSELVDR